MKKKKEKRKDVKRTHVFLEKVDPDWIREKGWFEALERFELGENFFSSVLLKREGKWKKEISFYYSIRTIKEDSHQKIVDHLWWNSVFLKGKMQDLFSPEELKLLKKRKKSSKRGLKIFFERKSPCFLRGFFREIIFKQKAVIECFFLKFITF